MQFNETALQGVYIIEPERRLDERGFFARTYAEDEFVAHGLMTTIAQCNVSFNPVCGTFRGMHFQKAPYQEAKLVRCTMGAIYDIALDLRADSVSYCQWIAIELTAQNHLMFYIPQGCAHGYLTLAAESEVFYQISENYRPELSSGVRWDDPTFGIALPNPPTLIAPKDLQFPDFVR